MNGSIVRTRKDCRLCNSMQLVLALPMRPSPIGDAYITENELSIPQASYPLSLYLCQDCGHLQLPDTVDPEILFRNYIYHTATSPGLVEHFRLYSDKVAQKIDSQNQALVVEVGSNDGSLLRFFKNKGMRVLGVDPAKDIAFRATHSGIETIPTFFTLEIARQIKDHYGLASIIAANNVFAHADNMNEIAEGIQYLLAPDGIFVFEVSYLVDMIEKNVFDTIYHEHLCHHRIEPLEIFFNRYDMCIFDVERIATKGGSIRCFVKHRHALRSIAPIVQELIRKENLLGLKKIEVYKHFAEQIEVIKSDVNKVLNDIKLSGKSIAGYGASTPVTTTIYHFELGPYLDFIADDNSIKQGRFSPGHHIPVLPSEAIYAKKPDYIIILAWQYADAIVRKHQKFIEQGGIFLVPIPKLKIISCESENLNS